MVDVFEKAANQENSLKTIAYATIAICAMPNSTKIRKKKPFNPMLGETYEIVTEKIKFISEKI